MINSETRRIGTYLHDFHYGNENAVTIDVLADIFGLTHRGVEKSLERLRCAGIPICSSCGDAWPKGVFYAANMEELGRYRTQVMHRIEKMSHNLKTVCDTMVARFSVPEAVQLTMFEDGKE